MTRPLCITGADIVTPFRVIRNGVLVVDGGALDQVGRRGVVHIPRVCERIDLPGRTILPGFVDLHIHGLAGYGFDEADGAGYEAAARALLKHGVTSALATLLPGPKAEMLERVRRVRAYLERPGRNPLFCGIHAEGPFLNPEMPGAIQPDHLWPAEMALAEELLDAAGPWLKLMTIAPELPGALDVIRRVVRQGCVPSIGHSKAHYEEVQDAIDCGLAQVTHIFNAMPLAHHRDPGVLGAAYTHQQLKVQLIADGIHVHPAIISFLAKVKGAGSILLISDAMVACDLPDGDYEFAGDRVCVRDGMAKREDGTLAGAAMALDGGVRNMVRLCGIPIGDAARMASLNSARVLNLDNRKGILAAGFDADFVILGPDMVPEMTVLGGRIVFAPQR